MIAQELAESCIAFLAWLLAAAALHKWLRPERGVAAVRGLLGVSSSRAEIVVRLAASLEAVTAVLACVRPLQPLAALLAASIYFSYLISMARAVLRGHGGFDCGCTLSAGGQPLGAAQLAKATALGAAACACAAVFFVLGEPVPSFTAALAGLAGFVLYFAGEELGRLVPLRPGEQS